MTTVTVSAEIDAPVESVFAVFTDIGQSAGRVSNILMVEMLTSGPVRLGSRWLETRELLGQRDTAEMEVTAFEPNRTYTITHVKAGARIDVVFTFAPAGGRTGVRVDFTMSGHGPFAGPFAPLRWAMAGKVRDIIGQDLADLKAYAERQEA